MKRRTFIKSITAAVAAATFPPSLVASIEKIDTIKVPVTPQQSGGDSWVYQGWDVTPNGIRFDGHYTVKNYTLTKREKELYIELDKALLDICPNERQFVNQEAAAYIELAETNKY